jgi:hypothetical protein
MELKKVMNSNKTFIPILYSTLMVQRIFSRHKKLTRREKGIPENTLEISYNEETGNWEAIIENRSNKVKKIIKCPYGKPGDIHWVRETFFYSRKEKKFYYKADNTELNKKWKPSIHMPKRACRLWLEIVSIRAERLQSITVEDIKAEGIILPVDVSKSLWRLPEIIRNGLTWLCYNMLWYTLWIKINGIQSWEKNPWVWVIEFKKIQKPKHWIS